MLVRWDELDPSLLQRSLYFPEGTNGSCQAELAPFEGVQEHPILSWVKSLSAGRGRDSSQSPSFGCRNQLSSAERDPAVHCAAGFLHRRSPGEEGTKTGASRAFYVEGSLHTLILLQWRSPRVS